jgi:hypothetical protein
MIIKMRARSPGKHVSDIHGVNSNCAIDRERKKFAGELHTRDWIAEGVALLNRSKKINWVLLLMI